LKNDRVRNSTPLHWASSKGHVDIIKLLLQVSAQATCDV
jgi:ankyrin repeat protein